MTLHTIIILTIIGLAYFPIAYIEKKLKIQSIIIYLILGIIISPYSFNVTTTDVIDNSFINNIFIIVLIITLAKGMLALDVKAIKENKKLTFKLGLIPVLLETVLLSTVIFVFLGFTIDTLMMSLLIGMMLAPVSPAVVVPFLSELLNKNKGKNREVPSVQLLAASIDDLVGVMLYYVIFIFYFGAKINITLTILAFTIMPLTLLYRKIKKDLTIEKFIIKWSRNILACIMFFMLGAKLDFSKINYIYLWILLGLLLVTLVSRYIGVLVSFKGTKYDDIDKRFAFFANLPKATVQASLGALPLIYNIGTSEFQILSISLSVFMIIITAPVGSMLMSNAKFSKMNDTIK